MALMVMLGDVTIPSSIAIARRHAKNSSMSVGFSAQRTAMASHWVLVGFGQKEKTNSRNKAVDLKWAAKATDEIRCKH